LGFFGPKIYHLATRFANLQVLGDDLDLSCHCGRDLRGLVEVGGRHRQAVRVDLLHLANPDLVVQTKMNGKIFSSETFSF
jgi:hypothetical protein